MVDQDRSTPLTARPLRWADFSEDVETAERVETAHALPRQCEGGAQGGSLMLKLKLLNAALVVALGLSSGVASAQSDQAAQQGNALDKPSNKAEQQAVGIPAEPGTQSGPTVQ